MVLNYVNLSLNIIIFMITHTVPIINNSDPIDLLTRNMYKVKITNLNITNLIRI